MPEKPSPSAARRDYSIPSTDPSAWRRFDNHPDYSQLLSGAHRKPATPLGTPALVSHIALWQPVTGEEDSRDKNNSIRTAWIKRVDKCLFELAILLMRDYGATCRNTDRPNFSASNRLFLFLHVIELNHRDYDKSKLVDHNTYKHDKNIDNYFASDYQSIVFEYKWHFIRTCLRIEKHHEYITISVFLDLADAPLDGNGELIPDATLLADEFRAEVVDRFTSLETLLAKGIRDDNKFARLHYFLYDGVWERFAEEMLDLPSYWESKSPGPAVKATDKMGEPPALTWPRSLGLAFASFRGIVLGKKPAGVDSGASFGFRGPGWRRRGNTPEPEIVPSLTSSEGVEVVRTLWPFLTSETRVPLRKYEFTASRMLGGRALYVTALGAQPSPYQGPGAQERGDQLPLYYFVYSQTGSRWQIGRLVDRIHHLGTVRLAAIQEVHLLREFSSVLRSVVRPVDQKLSELLEEQSDDKSTSSIHEVAKVIETAQSEIAGWNKMFVGGLQYRIERSRYYAKQFTDGIAPLRIRRVEGYQPYDIFVERRLGAAFDFIDRVGTRHERLDRRLNNLYQYVLANIARENANRARENSAKLVNLQAAAEALFFAMLAPYYTMGIVEHIFKDVDWASASVLRWIDTLILAAFLMLALERYHTIRGKE